MQNQDFDGKELLTLLCTVILPPLGVFFKVGLATQFWINLVLTIFGFYIAGLIHGIYVIIKK
jgi:uncharacterized membrane protein YqaE (UPF0057 family)